MQSILNFIIICSYFNLKANSHKSQSCKTEEAQSMKHVTSKRKFIDLFKNFFENSIKFNLLILHQNPMFCSPLLYVLTHSTAKWFSFPIRKLMVRCGATSLPGIRNTYILGGKKTEIQEIETHNWIHWEKKWLCGTCLRGFRGYFHN